MKLIASLALALSMAMTLPLARADGMDEAEARRMATRFSQLAGSEENAVALVLALRTGNAVRLVEERSSAGLPETVSLALPTAPMPWSDVRIALLHAQDLLVHAGHTRPGVAQLQAALLGGEILDSEGRRVNFRGVLCLRAEGMTWIEIARATAPANTSPAFLGR
jgi:hypothetical protein